MSRSLLIVDDDKNQLLPLAQLLSGRGYRVVTADHPRRALVAASADEFQVAVIDASLPEMDGFELMKRLKRTHNELQVIILSGYDFAVCDIAERGRGAALPFACLVKPCDLALLKATIEDAFDHSMEDWQSNEDIGKEIEPLLGVPAGA